MFFGKRSISSLLLLLNLAHSFQLMPLQAHLTDFVQTKYWLHHTFHYIKVYLICVVILFTLRCVSVCVCVCACMCACARACVHVCVYVFKHSPISVYHYRSHTITLYSLCETDGNSPF